MRRDEPTILFHVGAVPPASRLVQRCLQRNPQIWRRKHTHGLPMAALAADLSPVDALVSHPEVFAASVRDAFARPGIDVVAGSAHLLGPAFGGPARSGLHAGSDDAIQALAEATRPYRRAIVLSVCPQADLLEMYYQRAINSLGAACSEEWLDSVDLENLSWLPLHDRLVAAFGSDAVTVVDFRRTDEGPSAFLREVFAAADVELPDVVAETTPPPRPRLSGTGVRLAIAAQPHLRRGVERTSLRSFLHWNFSELEAPPGTVLSAAQGAAIHQRYDSELASLLRTVSMDASGGAK
jgi:hypothetical protein